MTCLLSFTNWLDRAAVSITASSEVLQLGSANLREPSLRARWRTLPGETDAALTVDLGAAREIGVLALVQPPDAGGWDADGEARGWMASTDTVRHRLDLSTPGGDGVLDTGAQAGGWAPGYGVHTHVPPAALTARHWRMDLSAPSLAAVPGYVDIGRAWIGPAFRPLRNFAYGASRARVDSSRVQVNPRSALEAVDVGTMQRVVRFSLASLTEDEAEAVLPDLLRVTGTRGQVLFIPEPGGPYAARQSIIGRLTQVPAFSQPNFAFHAADFELRETV
jgi:hypothetical protein